LSYYTIITEFNYNVKFFVENPEFFYITPKNLGTIYNERT
jgi:hypothetical protein